MLAFVFWHHRTPGSDATAYADALVRFHEMLTVHPPPGFLGSHILQPPQAAWMPDAPEVFEDWYHVQDFTALGVLNQAAVGIGGIYKLVGGTNAPAQHRVAHWFGKPAWEPTADFWTRLRPWTDQAGVALWQRQMNLSPAPEYVLYAPTTFDLPVEVTWLHTDVPCLWAGPQIPTANSL